MSETALTSAREDQIGPEHAPGGHAASGRRLLRRPTLAETERIARDCPTEGLSVPVIVRAIRQETGCSRAAAYRAVSDAFAAGVLSWKWTPTREKENHDD